ncbi:flavin reductase family protein [Clostridium sp. C2-6-12]|uniref:flavin reductase family protein n=1 Tax=Clostridium sp. C2-6-12 TaxID=2698832 RepID=UPI00136A7644|nr:flavin reductase family protein [Clostridium sp. C2-6-12]
MNKVDFKGSVILNPVPVVLITSKNNEGKTNVFTVGWTGTINTKPPMLYISIRPERLSYEYIKESMEFVVNLPSSDMVKKVDYCGVRSGKKNDKITEMGFTLKDSLNISTPYIEECPVNIECKVTNIVPLGTHDMFIAEVVGSHVDETIIDEKGKIRFDKANMMAYCHGEYFPLAKNPIGSFGFSVMKKKTKKRRREKIKEGKKKD